MAAPGWLSLVLLLTVPAAARFPGLSHLAPAASEEQQSEAVRQLCRRLLGPRADDFVLAVRRRLPAGAETADPTPNPAFELSSLPDGRVQVLGNSGVAAAAGLYWYLRAFCGCHVSWSGRQLRLPRPLPRLDLPLRITAPDRFRYYQNVCSYSYSFVWWDWDRWEREIDWMALSGINLALAFTGQEAIWQRRLASGRIPVVCWVTVDPDVSLRPSVTVTDFSLFTRPGILKRFVPTASRCPVPPGNGRQVYLSLGLTQAEIDDYSVGPAFLAWARMGNMHSWAGPLSDSWHKNQLSLQHRILRRMRSLGMLAVLPAFAGFVPASFTRLFPKENVTRLGSWGHLNCTYSCSYLLDPESAVFQQVGRMFLTELTQEFGTDHVYGADAFNEMTPRSSDPGYLSSVSNAIFKSMTQVDPASVWLMQGWLFLNRRWFWGPTQVKSLLHGVPPGRMVVLDLFAQSRPAYPLTQSFYGQPFIWCVLNNFGGNAGLYGEVERVNAGPSQARAFPNSSMVGTGVTPEGIGQNDALYELANEVGWRRGPLDLRRWAVSYARRRYGSRSRAAEAAWTLLFRSVYNDSTGRQNHNRSPLVRRPSLGLRPELWYNKTDVYRAWALMQGAAAELNASDTFRYDLVDLTRQSAQLLASEFYRDIVSAFSRRSVAGLLTAGEALVHRLLPALDRLLSSDGHFLLGRWIGAARSLGATVGEADLYEFNARSQITLWGPGGNLLDYANKQWGGLVRDYYAARWQLFVSTLIRCLELKIPFSQARFDLEVFEVEKNFTVNQVKYPDEPAGDTIEIARKIFLEFYPQAMKRGD